MEISLNHLNSDNLRHLVVQRHPVSVLEGGTVVIAADNLDISPLKQAVRDVVPRGTAKDLDVSLVVKKSPDHGVLRVRLAA